MEHFINEYGYTSQIIEEMVRAWWDWKYKTMRRILPILALVFLVLYVVQRRGEFLIFEATVLCLCAIYYGKRKKAIQTEKDRLQVMYQGEEPVIRVEIGEMISVQSTQSNRTISLSEVEAILETESLIVLCISGMLTIPMTKDGFREGTAEACLSYLRQKTGKK